MDFIKYLPERYYSAIEGRQVNEIRIRCGGLLSFTINSENIVTDIICTKKEINETVLRLCSGSLHTHEETIKNGYIALPDGIRVGVCGKAVTGGGKIKNIYDITSLNIRIPKIVKSISGAVMKYLSDNNYRSGVLIYSSPGIGKTTLLRDIAYRLATKPIYKRVALIDERAELYIEEMMQKSLIDVFYGYPKPQGIEIATRTMSPEILICDEIGSEEEALALLSVQNTGVPLIASAHAENLDELLGRKNISILHENNIFSCYFGIKRMRNDTGYKFTITKNEGDLCRLNT